MMMRRSVALGLLGAALLGGCAGLTAEEKGAIAGGAVGAGSGALIGGLAGGGTGAGVGALIGGAGGALGGYFLGERIFQDDPSRRRY